MRQAWQRDGRLLGLARWARMLAREPSFIAHRPALGLLRRIVRGAD